MLSSLVHRAKQSTQAQRIWDQHKICALVLPCVLQPKWVSTPSPSVDLAEVNLVCMTLLRSSRRDRQVRNDGDHDVSPCIHEHLLGVCPTENTDDQATPCILPLLNITHAVARLGHTFH